MVSNAEFTIKREEYTDKEMKYLFSRFAEGAKEARDVARVEDIFFSLKDESGKLVGGIQGYYFYGSGIVDMLWVEKEYRKKGFGKQLLKKFEEYVISKGATFMTISTMDWWNAVPFYESMGYKIEFIRKGFVKGSKQYMLRKNF